MGKIVLLSKLLDRNLWSNFFCLSGSTNITYYFLQISRLESEFSAYKVRAHALLQKKDAELSAAKNSDLVKAQEEALKV